MKTPKRTVIGRAGVIESIRYLFGIMAALSFWVIMSGYYLHTRINNIERTCAESIDKLDKDDVDIIKYIRLHVHERNEGNKAVWKGHRASTFRGENERTRK